MNHPTEWVKLNKYCEITGDTPDAVHSRRRAGKWLDGIHCKLVDGNLWVNLKSAQQWVEAWGTPKARAA